MKKRIAALVLLFVMLCSVVLTSCNKQTEIDPEEQRRARTITLYCITGEETTQEAIKRVEEALNRITKKRYSTQIVLRFFTKDKYDQVIDDLVADIALEQKQLADYESESAAQAKESKRIAAIDKLISIDKAEVTTRKLIIWSTETEEDENDEEEETFETEKNIFDEDVEKYPDVTDTQLDIFLICGTENLNKYVSEEPYASDGESFLVPMDEALTLKSKSIKQYVNQNILLAGKVGNVQYAIPTNKRMAGDSTYLVLDKELLGKYGFKEEDIRSLTSDNFAAYLAAIKENEPDIVPFLSAPEAPGVVSLFGEKSIFGTYVANTAVTGFKAVPKNLLSAYQYTDHVIYMEQYKRNGYIPETVDENARWGAAVVKASDSDIEDLYDPDKYAVKVLSKGMATTETIGEYMFGISKYTKDVERCMEVITLINTNPEIRNLLQYGVGGYNYRIDPDTGKLVRLNNEYMMDIFSTGNTFIAYPEEDMELDEWEKAKAANQNAIVSPYLGFLFEKENNAELIEKMKALSESVLQQVKDFNVEQQRLDQIAKLEEQKAGYQKEADEYKASLDLIAADAESYISRINAAEEALAPYTEALNKAKSALQPYDKEIDNLNNRIKSLQSQITAEEKVKPTEEKPDLAPDQAKIDDLKKQIEELQTEIRAQRGYSYEIRKEYNAAQAAYDEKNKVLTDLQAEYKSIYLLDDEGNPTKILLQTAYDARRVNYESRMADVEKTQSDIDALMLKDQADLDAQYAELTETVREYTEKVDALNEELKQLNIDAVPFKEAITAADEAVTEAKAKVDQALEAYQTYRAASAVALSYVEDKEKEVSTADGKVKAKEAEIANRKDDSNLEKLNTELDTLKADLDKLNTELASLKNDYEKTFENGKSEKAAYDAAVADLEAKTAAAEAARNADVLKQISEKESAKSEANVTLKNASSALDSFMKTSLQHYDEIAKKLYNEFFKSIVTDLEKNNPDYQQFMNIGEEQADNENGIVAIYNDWYSATYGE